MLEGFLLFGGFAWCFLMGYFVGRSDRRYLRKRGESLIVTALRQRARK